jgi:hypothetical protein
MLHLMTITTLLLFPFLVVSIMYSHASKVWASERAAHDAAVSISLTTTVTTFGHLVVAANPNGVELSLPEPPTSEEVSWRSLENEEEAKGLYAVEGLPLALACNRPESERPNERAEREGLIQALEAWIYG